MASYKDAVAWIARNDDGDLGDDEEGGFIVSVCFVADLWNKEPRTVKRAVERLRKKEGW